ncbi:MAG TPA: VTT domain-containing protein [Dehalococcoidia bacterium]|nr:VTT domain-containing protein [Dehalococcoidia bacterium]
MAEESAKAHPQHEDMVLPAPPERRLVLDMPPWLPTEKVPRWAMVAAAAAFVLALVVGTTVPFALGWLSQGDLKSLGYPGIFLANFLGTATVFVPVPGLTAAGQTLIVLGAGHLFKPGVVLAGASGMTLAESTAYLAGAVARGVAEERQMPVGGRVGQWLHRAADWIDWLMARYGFATLLVLAGVPNPLFEFAGITAGAVRMNFWRFLLAVGIGKTARVILLVIVGQALLDAFKIG